MVFPLTKLNKEGTLLNASHSYYTEEYAQRMCSLYLTDELSRDDTGKIKKTYRLHASNDHTEEMAFAHEIHCPKCGNRLKQIVWYLAVLGVNTPFKFAVFVLKNRFLYGAVRLIPRLNSQFLCVKGRHRCPA